MTGFDDVVICCPQSEPYWRDATGDATGDTRALLARLLRRLIEAATISRRAIDGLCLSSFTLAPDGPAAFAQQAGLTLRHLDGLPMGGAAGCMAVRRAARAVAHGDAGIVACLAADTFGGGSFEQLLADFSTQSRDFVWPYGAAGPNGNFALLTDAYMRRTGARREDFGKLCVAQRQWARANPAALFGDRALSLETYMRARPIAEPIHLYDCVAPCSGGEGLLVMSRDRAARLGLRGVRLLAAMEWHNAWPEDPVQHRGGWSLGRDRLWRDSGVGPQEMDLVQTYDDYPVMSMIQFEGLGLCAEDRAPEFVRTRDFAPGGDMAHNTSGGQLSCGQAGAAGGFLGLTEAIRQLTGAATGRQLARARHALVSGFGMINYDRGLCSSAVVLAA